MLKFIIACSPHGLQNAYAARNSHFILHHQTHNIKFLKKKIFIDVGDPKQKARMKIGCLSISVIYKSSKLCSIYICVLITPPQLLQLIDKSFKLLMTNTLQTYKYLMIS